MHVVIAGKKVRISPAQALGKGGEADVYDVGGGKALKLYKAPDHPDLEGQPEAQRAARARLDRAEEKLRAFPQGLPDRVISPLELAHGPRGEVVGFTMRAVTGATPLSRYAEPPFRRAGVPHDEVVRVFKDLHGTVTALHRAGVVIGDFNDLNVLVKGGEALLIDADSFQFGPFAAEVFTERFTDPLLCATGVARPLLARPFTTTSDWYAFSVLLMQSLLFVGPYGGVYRPKDPRERVPEPSRPLKRITVFHPEVRTPKAALPFSVLPDELLQHLAETFERDERRPFPRPLLDALRFVRCTSCGTEHARPRCPACTSVIGKPVQGGLAMPPAVLRRRGQVTARRVFSTPGTILHAEMESGALRLVHHDGARYLREDGSLVREGALDPRLSFRIAGRRTLVGREGALDVVEAGRVADRQPLDAAPSGALAFGASGRRRFWLQGGQLLRNGAFGPERVGDVLLGQTRLFTGPDFGFGLYEAGALRVAFVFDAERPGLSDGVRLPRFPGRLVRLSCRFSSGAPGARALVVATCESGGTRTFHALLLSRQGSVLAEARAAEGDAHWLAQGREACLVGDLVFVATDDGLVRVEAVNGALTKTREFPDTEPFVSAHSRLLFGKEGLLVVDDREVLALTLT